MKIDQNIQLSPGKLESTQKTVTTRTTKEAAAPDKTGAAAFSVTISKTAGQLAKATELLAKAPAAEDGIRHERVAAIREQLASGSYTISGKDVATKILNVLKS
ncbi:MAG: flagellar biosynthesis anti-sigma factor FlgM [Desulfuromonadales bacterium]|nr:flagellar biosynthesis anti-sigma factor FlgM [Desulfuromonadales bacterium]